MDIIKTFYMKRPISGVFLYSKHNHPTLAIGKSRI